MSHERKVRLPGAMRPLAAGETRESQKGSMNTDFGFGKTKGVQDKRSPLESSYDHWNGNQTGKNMKALLDVAQPVLRQAITSYGGGERALTGRAKRLAIDAFRTFDPTRGTKIRTHLLIRMQPLQRQYLKRVSPLRVPERVQVDQYRLRQAEQQYKEVHNREASDEELANELQLSTKRISHVRGFMKGLIAEGQSAQPGEGVSLPSASEVTPEDIWIEFVHHDLTPTDKKIMEWKVGYNGKKQITTNEIARRLGISPSAVSQRAGKIAARMEEGMYHGSEARPQV